MAAEDSQKKGLALRWVIGIVCGITVLTVAAATLTVSSLFAITAIEGVADSFSLSLLISARSRAEHLLSTPAKQLRALAVEAKRNDSGIPTDIHFEPNSPIMDVNVLCPPFRYAETAAKYNYSSIDLLYDDASVFRVMSFPSQTALGTDNGQVACVLHVPADVGGSTPASRYEFQYTATSTPVPAGSELSYAAGFSTTAAARFATLKALYNGNVPADDFSTNIVQRPQWMGFKPYSRGTAQSPHLDLVLAMRVANRTKHPLGILTMHVAAEPLHEALQTLEATANSRIFILYNGSIVLGSTAQPPIRNYEALQAAPGTKPSADCYSAPDTADEAKVQIICPRTIDSYGYAPLKQLKDADAALLRPAPGSAARSSEIDVGGTTYFVGSASVDLSPAAGGMDVSIVFLLPKEDVTGAVTQGTFIVIGVAAGILVIATLLAVFVVVLVLKPLETVSHRMHRSSKLQSKKKNPGGHPAAAAGVAPGAIGPAVDGNNEHAEESEEEEDGDDPDSSISEIAALSSSYVGMNSALTSFEKYIPREVIKDLMASDQLCRLGMVTHTISTLQTDIAGFTSISERVQPEQMGDIINVYFERLSDIISFHSGIISMFVGDAIVAMWNTPCVTPNHEIKAVLCAISMERELCLDPIKCTWDAVGENPHTRIGVHVSPALCGNFGSANRMSYAVLGEGVQVGADLEAGSKMWGVRISISGDLEVKVRNICCCRLIAPVHFGCMRDEAPIAVYAVHGLLPRIEAGSVLDGDEESISMSMASVRSGRSDNRSLGKGAVSKRVNAKRNTKTILKRAQRYTEQTVAACEAEASFCLEYKKCVEAFGNRDAQSCLKMMQELRGSHPAFFDGGEQDLKQLVGPNRCAALIIQAEKSAKMIEEQCRTIIASGNSEIDQFMIRAGH